MAFNSKDEGGNKSAVPGVANPSHGDQPPVKEEKVVETVDYRSPAAEDPRQIRQERPVEIVHEIHGGERDKSSAPKQD